MAFTGPGIACDWLDIEGPLHDVWPPHSHRLLFGDLPLVEFKPAEHPGIRPPARKLVRQTRRGQESARSGDRASGRCKSEQPLADADRLLAAFLPKAFRRPVEATFARRMSPRSTERLKAGDCFETAMRWAYRAALCSPDFLYHVEPAGKLDDHALASRLSYFFWNSMPDATLTELADSGKLHDRPRCCERGRAAAEGSASRSDSSRIFSANG